MTVAIKTQQLYVSKTTAFNRYSICLPLPWITPFDNWVFQLRMPCISIGDGVVKDSFCFPRWSVPSDHRNPAVGIDHHSVFLAKKALKNVNNDVYLE